MIGIYVVLLSALIAIAMGFIMTPFLVWVLRRLDGALRRDRLETQFRKSEVNVIDLPFTPQASAFRSSISERSSQAILAAALTLTVVTISVQPMHGATRINA